MIDIVARVKVPEKCGHGCLLCDVDYSTFGGWCNLFNCKLEIGGMEPSKWFNKCEACKRGGNT